MAELAASLEGDSSAAADAQRARIARLQGVITFALRTEYHERLDVFARHLKDLADSIEVLRAEHRVRARATGGRAQLRGLRHADQPAARASARGSAKSAC